MTDTGGREWPEPQVGYWWAACCAEDLYLIETEADLADVVEWIDPEDPPVILRGIWPTKEEALADLASDGWRVSDVTRARLGL